jgi:hypothetical protein
MQTSPSQNHPNNNNHYYNNNGGNRNNNNSRSNNSVSRKSNQSNNNRKPKDQYPNAQGQNNSGSWSSVVKQQSAFRSVNDPLPSPPPSHNSPHPNSPHPNSPHQQKRYRKAQSHHEVNRENEEDYNADEKINQIQNAVQTQLSAMELKTEKLKSLQEDIKVIKADGDGQIEQLEVEMNRLILKLAQVKQEIELKDRRVFEIDRDVETIKKR